MCVFRTIVFRFRFVGYGFERVLRPLYPTQKMCSDLVLANVDRVPW